MNPYSHNNIFQFFFTFFSRLEKGFPGGFVSDEIQLMVLITVALSSALVGTFLVWRQMAMLANALSHTILAGIVLTYLGYHFFFQNELDFEQLLPSDTALIVSAILTALITTFLTQTGVLLFGISEDSSTGMVFTFLFALGIVLVTCFTRNSHIGAELLMGNADLVQMRDLYLSTGILVFNSILVLIFWRPYFVTSFDPVFAKVLGFSIPLCGYLLMAQVAVTAIGAFRAVGVLLFLAFMVAPPICARLWVNQYGKVLFLSCAIGSAAAFFGVALSRHLLSFHGISCSTGALVVTILFVITLISMGLKALK